MTNPNFAEEDDKPLDPAMEKVRRKMVRLLVISSSVIIVGLMAVVFSIVYRVNNNSAKLDQRLPASEAAIAAAAHQTLTLPAGFKVETTQLDGSRILLTGTREDGAKSLVVYDFAAGKILTEIGLANQ